MVADGTQLGILCFLLALLAALAGTGLLVLAVLLKKHEIARWIARVGVGAAAFYAAMLLVVSLKAPGYVLAQGQEKHFCEVDCHLAYSVTGVSTAKALGPQGARRSAQGTFYVVALRVRFDEKTISAHRGDRPLWPNPRWVQVVDADGKSYLLSLEGQAAWEAANGVSPGLDRPVRPGQSYATTLVFDLPDSARNPQLSVTSPDFTSIFVIGNENSFFHRKATFRI